MRKKQSYDTYHTIFKEADPDTALARLISVIKEESITQLNLRIDLDEAFLMRVLKELIAKTKLEELIIHDDRINNEMLITLAVSLKHNKYLERLEIVSNQITAKGTLEFTNLLKNHQTITDLHLSRVDEKELVQEDNAESNEEFEVEIGGGLDTTPNEAT